MKTDWILVACMVIAGAVSAQAQTLEEVRAEAAGSWELVACAAMYNMADRIVADGGAPVTAVTGGGELLGMGVAMVRSNTLGEDIDTAVDIAVTHVERVTVLMTEIYDTDPAGFPQVVGWPDKMEVCDRYAASVAEMMGAPAE